MAPAPCYTGGPQSPSSHPSHQDMVVEKGHSSSQVVNEEYTEPEQPTNTKDSKSNTSWTYQQTATSTKPNPKMKAHSTPLVTQSPCPAALLSNAVPAKSKQCQASLPHTAQLDLYNHHSHRQDKFEDSFRVSLSKNTPKPDLYNHLSQRQDKFEDSFRVSLSKNTPKPDLYKHLSHKQNIFEDSLRVSLPKKTLKLDNYKHLSPMQDRYEDSNRVSLSEATDQSALSYPKKARPPIIPYSCSTTKGDSKVHSTSCASINSKVHNPSCASTILAIIMALPRSLYRVASKWWPPPATIVYATITATIVYASLLAFKYTNPTDSYMFETPASKQHKIKTPISRWPKYYLAMPRAPFMAAPAGKQNKNFHYEVIVNTYEVPESHDFKHSSQEPPPKPYTAPEAAFFGWCTTPEALMQQPSGQTPQYLGRTLPRLLKMSTALLDISEVHSLACASTNSEDSSLGTPSPSPSSQDMSLYNPPAALMPRKLQTPVPEVSRGGGHNPA